MSETYTTSTEESVDWFNESLQVRIIYEKITITLINFTYLFNHFIPLVAKYDFMDYIQRQSKYYLDIHAYIHTYIHTYIHRLIYSFKDDRNRSTSWTGNLIRGNPTCK